MTHLRVYKAPETITGVADSEPSPVLPALLDPATSREEVLDRVDRDALLQAPFNLLLSTAIAMAPAGNEGLVEDAVIRETAALTHESDAFAAHARISAENFVLANKEYQAAIVKYSDAFNDAPARADWTNPQHFLEATKNHLRLLDHLLKAKKEAHERVIVTSDTYRQALLTRDGLELLRTLRIDQETPGEKIDVAVKRAIHTVARLPNES